MWTLGELELSSRLLMGTARFPSPQELRASVSASQTEVVTLSLRREAPGIQAGKDCFTELIEDPQIHILPNTSGCETAKEAIAVAHMAREILGTTWLKLEVIGDDYTLFPHTRELVDAAITLVAEGFTVFPYTSDDPIVAEHLLHAGCKILMPLAAPIGSGQGLLNPTGLQFLRDRFPEATLIVDAGIGKPSEAARVMEMGFDGVLVNTAIASACKPVQMAEAFKNAVEAGRQGYLAGLMHPRQTAEASSPLLGTPFRFESP